MILMCRYHNKNRYIKLLTITLIDGEYYQLEQIADIIYNKAFRSGYGKSQRKIKLKQF